MIDFDNIFYGKVRIYECEDVEGQSVMSDEEVEERLSWELHTYGTQTLSTASVVAFRDLKRNYVRLIKNRYAPLEDYETEQFILNYGREPEPGVVEIFDPIESRFEILDL